MTTTNPSLTKKELLLVIIASTLILAWTSIPNWVGYNVQNDQLAFRGTFFDPTDYSVHIAMIQAGMQGEWAYTFRFTTEPQQAAYIRMFYIVLGEINRLFRANPELVFQVARWLWGYAALVSIFALTRRIFESRRGQWLAFFLIVFGTGLGWLQVILNASTTPTDFWLIDAYVLFSLAMFPHFAFTLALMCVALIAYFDYLRSARWEKIVVVIISAILVQFVNPIAFILVDITITAAAFLNWIQKSKINRAEFVSLAVIATAQVPLFLYNFILLSRDPIWSQFTAQNTTPSPPFIDYLWGFGLLWILAIIGAVRAFRKKSSLLLSFAIWIILAFILAYMPFAIQRRFLLGITIPFGVLSTYGLLEFFESLSTKSFWRPSRIAVAMTFVIIALSMTSIFQVPAFSFYLMSRPEKYFYPRTLNAAFEWIDTHTAPNDFILSDDQTGQLVAQKTGRRVYLGHLMETINYTAKVTEVKSYYQDELPTNWVSQYPISWVIYGPYEKQIAPDFQPNPDLELVYQSDDVQIYKVK